MGFNVKKALKKVDKVVSGGSMTKLFKTMENTGKKVWNDWTGNTAIDKQNEYNMKMWQMQNEYNTPANQMQRYLEAGLNPNLIYSQGNAGNASSAPEMQAHQSSFSKIMDLFSTFFGMASQVRSQELHELNALSSIQHSADVLDFQKHQFAVEQAYRQVQGDRWQKDFDERVRHNKAMEDAPKGGLFGFLDRVGSSFYGKPINDVATDTGNVVKKLFEFGFNNLFDFMKKGPMGVSQRDLEKYLKSGDFNFLRR